MKKADLIVAVIKIPVDFVMLLAAAGAAYWIRVSGPITALRPALFEGSLPFSRLLLIAAIIAPLWLIIFALAGLYRITNQNRLWIEFTQILIGVSAAEMALIGFLFMRGEAFDSRFIVLAVWLFAIVFVSLGRLAVRIIQRRLVGRYNIGVHHVLLIGDDAIAHVIKNEIETRPDLGYRLALHVPELDIAHVSVVLNRPGIHEVIVASPDYARAQVLELVDLCEELRIGFRYVPSLLQASTMNVVLETFGGVPIVEVRRTRLEGWGRIWKRVSDVLGGVILLIISSPGFLVTAILIRLDSSGPVFVRLQRISRGKSFGLLKFRSMIDGAHSMREDLMHLNERGDGPLFKMTNDPRVTRVGRWIRKYRIDEFPQLINVIRGDMSLVGPRPHEEEEILRYERHHKKQLLIKPGLTGLAQVSGASGLSFDEEVKLDTYYIESWSPWMDIWILIKTIFVVINPHESA